MCFLGDLEGSDFWFYVGKFLFAFFESFEGHFWLKFVDGGVGEGFRHIDDLEMIL